MDKPDWPEMKFEITKTHVTAHERTLPAEYTIQIAQDLEVCVGDEAIEELALLFEEETILRAAFPLFPYLPEEEQCLLTDLTDTP